METCPRLDPSSKLRWLVRCENAEDTKRGAVQKGERGGGGVAAGKKGHIRAEKRGRLDLLGAVSGLAATIPDRTS